MTTRIECGVCGKTEPEHAQLNHVFGSSGQLIPKSPRSEPKIVHQGDYLLRALLVEKGIVEAGDLAMKEAELHARIGDRASHPPDRRDID